MTKLLLMCEGAYIASAPDEPVPSFEITDEHRVVVLLSGVVRCLNTREKLVAPCIIPHNVRYIHTCTCMCIHTAIIYAL